MADPLARFEGSFDDVGEDVKERFYADNFVSLFGTVPVAAGV